MNDGFLAADCVFNFLFNSDFMYHSDWMRETKELYYNVSFTVKGTRASTVSFEIIISNGNYMITKSIVRLLEKRFVKNFNEVFSRCAVD
jgi:hypothetical protein